MTPAVFVAVVDLSAGALLFSIMSMTVRHPTSKAPASLSANCLCVTSSNCI